MMTAFQDERRREMMEAWAVIGRILLNESFHESLFAVAKNKRFFEDLDDFRKILRIDNHLNLGRWEIMVIHGSVTEKHPSITVPPVLFGSLADDEAVLAIRAGWSGGPPVFFDDFQLCAVVGLAAMDFKFRQDLHAHTDPDPQKTESLNDFLTNPQTESPRFALTALQLINLNRFMRSTVQGTGMVDLLRDYHIERWVQPIDYPCNGGYTETVGADGTVTSYVFFSQPALVRLAELEPEGKAMLRKHGVNVAG